MISVSSNADTVILDLHGRRQDILLGSLEAERFADALERYAAQAELADPSLVKGETWGCKVISFDRKVAIRFFPPLGSAATRVLIPFATARQLADQVRFTRQQASYGIRFQTEGAN